MATIQPIGSAPWAYRSAASLRASLGAWIALAEHEHLTAQVERGALAAGPEGQQHVRVLRRRAQNVLIRPVIEDQLEREGPGSAALLLGPRRVQVRDPANLDQVLRPLLLHLTLVHHRLLLVTPPAWPQRRP